MADEHDWDLYADHRAHFTDAIVSAATRPAGRLCLLGAGHCNDVDLARLAENFSEIHLVDIDAKALAGACDRQSAPVRARLRRHAPVDLSGMSKRLRKWKASPPHRSELAAASVATLRSLVTSLDGPFDVVASACVLTQMSFELLDVLGESHPALGLLRLSLMTTHLSTLVALTSVGGTSLFVSDLVSSTSYPLGDLPPDKNLYDVMSDILGAGQFYYAANPTLIQAILREDEALRERIGEPDLVDPWLWTGPLDRTYFVYGLRFARQS